MGGLHYMVPTITDTPAKDLEGIIAQIAEMLERVIPNNNNGSDVGTTGWCVVGIVIRPPNLPSAAASVKERIQAATDEQFHLEKFAWAFDDGKSMRTLRRFFLVGWAYQNGAKSLRDVLRKLRSNRQEFGEENVPASTKDYSDCATEVTRRFQDCIRAAETGEIELFVRKGDKPAFTDPDHQDTRAIIGLTEAGWQAWRETGLFLKLHGGPGLWISASTYNTEPAGRKGIATT